MNSPLTLMFARHPQPEMLIKSMGEAFYRSGMFGCKSPAQGEMMAWICVSEGKTPGELMGKYNLIEGKLSMKADGMLATWRERGGTHTVEENSPDAARMTLTGPDGRTYAWEYTWAQAQQSPWPYKADRRTLKKNWSTKEQRKDMLWARCVSNAIRRLAPDIPLGAYTPEEIEDFDEFAEKPIEVPMLPVQAPVSRPGFVQSIAAPASPELIQEIRTIGERLSQSDPGLFPRIQAVLAGRKLTDLDHTEATQLLNRLKEKDVAAFFGQSLGQTGP